MSGSGGGRDDYTPSRIPTQPHSNSGGEKKDDLDPCAIFQQAPLNSPNPAVVPTLNVGDILDVVLNTASARVILEVHAKAGVAGALTHTGHMVIVKCIQTGHQYVAEVINRSGAAVTVQVRPV